MNVALYARVSTKNQQKHGTIDSQIEALRNYAKAQGVAIAGIFEPRNWVPKLELRNLHLTHTDLRQGRPASNNRTRPGVPGSGCSSPTPKVSDI